jgi:predicted PurR-regulated permease PerM
MLLFLIAVLGYLAYQIISPFLTAAAWAMVFAIVFYPVYAYICRFVIFKSVASLITIVLILIIILGPVSYLTSLLVHETQAFLVSVDQDQLESMQKFYDGLRSSPLYQKMSSYIGELPSEKVIFEAIRKAGRTVLENMSLQITNALAILANFLFMIFTIFFFLKDGPRFLLKARDFMPFSEKHKDRLATQVKDMIVSTVYGGATVALIQGILGGFAYYIIGMNSPVMWGAAMAVMSFVPLLGTFSIWGPGSVFLLLSGSYGKGIGLFLFGVFVISMIDNILRPLIIGSRTKMPTILILFSVLGGIRLFGIIGFVMGPLIMAAFISVFEIFRHIEDEEKEEVGTGAQS